MNRLAIAAIGLGALALATAPLSRAQAADADWKKAIDKKLEQKMSFERQETSVQGALRLLQDTVGVTVTLDPAAAKAVADVKIDFSATEMSAAHVLGNILRMAGLRYAYADGALYVSTPGRVGAKLIEDSTGAAKASIESRPMTVSDVAVEEMNRTYYQEEHYSLGINGEGTRFFQKWRLPYVDPVTGLTQYPGPPIIAESDTAGGRGVWFTSQPYYVKPQYRGLVPQSLSDRVVVQEVVRKNAGDDTARQILRIIAENPNLTGAQILEKVNKELK